MVFKLRFVVILLTMITTVSLYSQKKENILVPEVPYDSTANYLGADPAQYTGQELWLKRMPEIQREMGYGNFILNYKKVADINDSKNVYKCCDGYNSMYYELQNKHFLVEQVFKEKIKDKEEYFFKLKELSDGDIVYYLYDPESVYSFPFAVMGYIEKQKELLKGKEFVFSDAVLLNAVDMQTLDPIKPVVGQKWVYEDVTVDNYHFEVSLIVKNPNGTKIAVPLADVYNETLPRKVYTWKEANDMQQKFGIYNYKRILQQKIASNMNKESLRLSWGEPLEVIKKGNTEEWVYTSGSVVFNGNSIAKIN